MLGQEPVPELLLASSHSAHPCDCALPWLLSTALQVCLGVCMYVCVWEYVRVDVCV
jgi:hypothetical protein